MKWWLFPLIAAYCLPLTAQDGSVRRTEHPCSLVEAGSGTLRAQDVGAFIRAYNVQAERLLSLHLETMLRVSAGSEFGVPGHLPELPATVDFVSPVLVHLSVPFPLTGARGFELTGDARRYSLLVPGARGRTFFTGPVDAPGLSSKPTENLRPATLIEALRWPKAMQHESLPARQPSTPDEIVLKVAPQSGGTESRTAKIKLDREAGTVSSLSLLNSTGESLSETTYADWHPVEQTPGTSVVCFPGTISMIQPGGQNSITLRILRVEWNAAIPERLFEHNPPKGTPVVQVGAAGTFTDK
jgi:hypothetical protein